MTDDERPAALMTDKVRAGLHMVIVGASVRDVDALLRKLDHEHFGYDDDGAAAKRAFDAIATWRQGLAPAVLVLVDDHLHGATGQSPESLGKGSIAYRRRRG